MDILPAHFRPRLAPVAVRLCAACSVVLVATLVAGESSKPNIVLIVADDLGYNETGFQAALNNRPTDFETPHLDALAQQSVVMRQGYSAASICAPSRAGLLTGLYQQRLGIEENLGNDANSPFGFTGRETLLTHRLKDQGYTTGLVGKWHEGFVSGVNRPNDMGFDEFFGFLSGSRQYYADVAPSNVMWRNGVDVESTWRTEGDASQYDFLNGRYATDAFGEEAAGFISRHAHDGAPFFLYSAFNAPHTPLAVKLSDYNHFAGITDPSRRTLAAMTFALDRAVGNITASLQANGIADQTLVVFMGDNGGDFGHDNGPLRAFKASPFEGGLRVPFLVKAPGVVSGVYDAPVNMYDLAPTFVAAAGGSIPPEDRSGVDLLPYLSGAQSGAPHQAMFWRDRTSWAVRQGDWKLLASALFNLQNDPGEADNVAAQNPTIAADMSRQFTFWEATLAKPRWGVLGTDDRNKFDHFVYRADQTTAAHWSDPGMWLPSGASNAKTLRPDDAYANAILEFGVRNDASYAATNDMLRISGQTFMLNQLRMTGVFSAEAARSATLNGKSLRLVKNLAGQGPRIQLDATSSETSSSFVFKLNNDLALLDDLEITGDGTQAFEINGAVSDYYEPRNVTKTGASVVTLGGLSTFRGTVTVRGGEVRITNPAAGISGASVVAVENGGRLTMTNGILNPRSEAGGRVVVESGGRLAMSGGRLETDVLEIKSEGDFALRGGRLKTNHVVGSVANAGGLIDGAGAVGAIEIAGDFSQTAGSLVLRVDLSGSTPACDYLSVTGAAQLGGALSVNFFDLTGPSVINQAPGTYDLVSAAGGVSGTFQNVQISHLARGLFWNLLYSPSAVRLEITGRAISTVFTADFNEDDLIDGADLLVWQRNEGVQTDATHAMGDANGDGKVDDDDLVAWKTEFGSARPTGLATQLAVPEPGAVCFMATLAAAAERRNRRRAVLRRLA